MVALQEEYEGKGEFPAFESYFPSTAPTHGPAQSEFTFLDAAGKEHLGILAILPKMGRLAAYSTTQEILATYRPSLAVNIGIAGNLARDVRRGDVVVANQIDDVADRKKIIDHKTGHGPQILLGPTSYSPSPQIVARAEEIRARSRDLYASWQRACAERFDIANAGRLSESAASPELHIGKIACDDTVVDSSYHKATLIQGNRNLLACEMEAAGFLQACQDQVTSFTLVIKAISDDADGTKGPTDQLGKSLWRGYAMSNAYGFLSMLLRTLSFPTAHDAVQVVVDSPAEDALLEIARQRFFKKQHVGAPTRFPELRTAYGQLFSHFLSGDILRPSADVFSQVMSGVEANEDEEPIHLAGEPGTGKTAFLTFLFMAFYHQYKERPADAPIPIFINIKEYLYPPPALARPSLWDPNIQWQQDLALLAGALNNTTAPSAIFIVDGIDEYSPVLERIEREVMGLVDAFKKPKRIIIGFGKNYLGDNPFFQRDFPYIRPPRLHLRLKPVRLSSKTAPDVVKSFLGILHTGGDSITPQQMLDQAHLFRFAALDMQTLSMLHDSLRDARYSGCKSVVDYFSVLCRTVLHKHRSDAQETIDTAADLAFQYALNPLDVDLVVATKSRAWKLIHVHPALNDFLIARYTIGCLKRAATAQAAEELQDLRFVFPYRINRFCKELANSSVDDQFDILNGSKRICSFGPVDARPHACYVVGRLQDASVQTEALSWLRGLEKDMRVLRESRNEVLSIPELLLARTIYISLAYLGNRRSSDEYLELIMRFESWNRINRGFHLEYYGDIPFNPAKQLSHADDNVRPFPFTYEILMERLRKHSHDLEYGLYEIEVFTLFSLAQVRHANGALTPQLLQDLLVLISQLLNARNRLSRPIRDYLSMLKKHFSLDSFRIGDVGLQLYQFKRRERAGWKKRNIQTHRIESVAEHTWGALLLGMLYLPDSLEHEERYDKETVLKMLIVHDLAEAITGDVAYHDQTEQTRLAEADAFKYIEMCGTYDRIADLKQWYALWKEFETAQTINAQVAQDIDKLDNLMQLNVYCQETTISDEAEFKADLLGVLRTDVGRDLSEIVMSAFRNDRKRPH